MEKTASGIGQNNMVHMGSFLKGETPAAPKPPQEQPKPEEANPTQATAQPTETPKPEQTDPASQEPKPKEEQPAAPIADTPPAADTSSEQPNTVEPTETPKPENQPLELDETSVLGFLKEKYGKEYKSIEDVFKPVEAPKTDPWEGVSDEVVQFKKYNEETGRGFEDFMQLNRDVSKLDPIQLAREKVGSIIPDLTSKQIDEYLESKLNIDVSNPKEMSVNDRIELESFVKDYRTQIKSDQEKYKQPVERPEQPSKVELKDLGNGIKMSEEDYTKFVNTRNQYINSLKNSTDKITSSAFEIKVDENGSEKTIQVGYDYSKEDKHKMMSSSMDTQATLEKLFTNDKGEIDFAGIQEAMFWANPELRAKAVTSLVHKTRAELLKESVKSRTNANFNPQPNLPKSNGATKTVPIPGTQTAHGIKHDFSQFIKSN